MNDSNTFTHKNKNIFIIVLKHIIKAKFISKEFDKFNSKISSYLTRLEVSSINIKSLKY